MKRTLLLITAAVLLSACSDTLNDKAEDLIEKDMKTTLVKPDTYDAIETKTDSAFTPQDDPQLFTLFLDIARENVSINTIEQSIADLKENMKNAEQGMNLASTKNDESYRKKHAEFKKYYDECQKQINEIEPKMDVIMERIQEKLEKMNELTSAKRQFIGYKSVHRYSAENQDGKELTDSCYYLFDKNMQKVVLSLPLDKYNVILQSIEACRLSNSGN